MKDHLGRPLVAVASSSHALRTAIAAKIEGGTK